MTREQQWVVLFLSLSLSLFFFLTNLPFTWKEAGRRAPQEPPPVKKSLKNELIVEVDGSVKRQGIYAIGPGRSVSDVIARAGGINQKMSLPSENLQRTIERSCRLHVLPAAQGAARLLVEPLSPQALKTLSVPIDLNTASVEELDTLPGIGPTIARAIVEQRQAQGRFNSAEDLLQVRGIGPRKLAAIRPHITVPKVTTESSPKDQRR
jgi:competence protein ComEA